MHRQGRRQAGSDLLGLVSYAVRDLASCGVMVTVIEWLACAHAGAGDLSCRLQPMCGWTVKQVLLLCRQISTDVWLDRRAGVAVMQALHARL